jgi:hypothetical protein
MFRNNIYRLFAVITLAVVTFNAYSAAPVPANNTCAGAISLSGATSSTTCTSATLEGSNVTGDPLASCNSSAENTSIWYSFVGTGVNQTIMADNSATSGVSCSHSTAVYSGTCASLTQVGCSYGFDAVAVQGTYTAGQTYYMQVSYASGGSCGDLGVCPYVCPTASNDACAGATGIDATPDATSNACATAGPTTNSPTITPAMLCAGSLENTVFYSFTVLNTADVVISMTGITCTGGGAGFQIGYFTGACGSLSNFGCNSGSGGTVTTTITGLTAGQVVTVAVDGNAGATCTFSISATNTVVVLPIELLFFEGKYADNQVKLTWTTATEHNNHHFTLEKTTDGTNFEFVAELPAAPGGNSSSALHYSAVDPNPSAGLTYYRLKQTDFDGAFEYSNLVPVIIEDEKDIFNIYPNPTQNAAQVVYRCSTDETAMLNIYDYNGRLVKSTYIQCMKGQNSASFSMEEHPDGLYFATLSANGKVYRTKLVKNKAAAAN